jgi:hypothetical protein
MVVSVPVGAFRDKEGSATVDQRGEANRVTGVDTTSRPYAFYVVAIAFIVILIAFVASMAIFRSLFEEATEVTTALSSLFTIVGTMLGAYFGIKVSSDTTDKTRGAIEKANDTANKALAALPPEEGRRIAGQPPGPAPGQPPGPAPEGSPGQPPASAPGQPGI